MVSLLHLTGLIGPIAMICLPHLLLPLQVHRIPCLLILLLLLLQLLYLLLFCLLLEIRLLVQKLLFLYLALVDIMRLSKRFVANVGDVCFVEGRILFLSFVQVAVQELFRVVLVLRGGTILELLVQVA